MGMYARFRRPSLRAQSGGDRGPLSNFWFDPDAPYALAPGQRVNADRLLTLPPFWRGIRLYTDNIASFQCNVHERMPRGHRPAPSHPDDYTIGRKPNPNNDAFQYWGTVVLHMWTKRASFSLKEYVPVVRRGKGFRRLQLWPLYPDRVTPHRRPDRTVEYEVRTENGAPVTYGSDQIFHVRNLSMDSLNALELPLYAASSASNMLAAERFTTQFYQSGTTAAVQALLAEGVELGPDQIEQLHRSILKFLGGLDNAYGVFVAPQSGIELKPIGVDPERAQLNATRQMTAVQACHWLNLPPGALGDSKTPTFAASKQFRLDLHDISLRPLCECLEAAIDTQLLNVAPSMDDEEDPTRFFAKFNMDALLRGAADERSSIYERDIRAGWRTRNEVRLKEDLEPLEGLDEPIVALNMGARRAGAGGRGGQTRRLDRGALITLQVAEQLVRKEIVAATKAAARHAADGAGWQKWLRTFYTDHAQEVAERLRLPNAVAKEYTSRQGLRLAERGIQTCEDWDRTVAVELAELALNCDAAAA